MNIPNWLFILALILSIYLIITITLRFFAILKKKTNKSIYPFHIISLAITLTILILKYLKL